MKSLYDVIMSKHLRITAVGDILAHIEILDWARQGDTYNFHPIFDKIIHKTKSSDLSFCNQESILGDIIPEVLQLHGGEYKLVGSESNPVFNSPHELGDAVVSAGFNMISLANNHVLDNGEDAVISSLNFWRDQNVVTSGSWSNDISRLSNNIHRCKDISYAFFAYTTKTNTINPPKGKEYLTNIFSKDKAIRDIESVRGKVDLIIVSMHWGTEYNLGKVNDKQKEIAKFLSDLDVDIVIGHHPHVIEPIEKINNTLVIYSLGNFVARQDGDDLMKRIGAIVTIDVDIYGKKKKLTHKVELSYIYYSSDFKDFCVFPFSELNDELLPNYKHIESEYLKYIIS